MKNRETTIWSPPRASAISTTRGQSAAKAFAIVGAVLTVVPFPMFASVMVNIAIDLESIVGAAQGDPEVLAGELSTRLVPVVLSLVVAFFGFLVAICAAGFGAYRAKWFFWTLAAASVAYVLAFPVGTLLALTATTLIWRKRAEFLQQVPTDTSA